MGELLRGLGITGALALGIYLLAGGDVAAIGGIAVAIGLPLAIFALIGWAGGR